MRLASPYCLAAVLAAAMAAPACGSPSGASPAPDAGAGGHGDIDANVDGGEVAPPPPDAAAEAAPGDAAAETSACRTLDTTCDGVDDDCDGTADDDYVPRLPECLTGQCAAGATTCVRGAETVACRACAVPQAVPGSWRFYHHAVDFDVSGDKLCFIPSVAGAGPLGGVTCTSSPGGADSVFVPLATPEGFTEGCGIDYCTARVSLDARGRVWASRPDGVFTEDDGGALVRIADPPPDCNEGSAITAIEVAGPTPSDPRVRPFVICGDAGGSVASQGEVYELVREEGRWIDLGFSAGSMAASPSRGHQMFFGGPAPTGGPGFFRLADDGTLEPLGRIGSGIYGQVGGIYVAAQAPFP